MFTPSCMTSSFKLSACLFSMCLLSACARNTNIIRAEAMTQTKSPDNPKIIAKHKSQNRRRPPVYYNQPILQGRKLTLMSNEQLMRRVSQIAPRFVNPTGPLLDNSPGLVVGIISEEGKSIRSYGNANLENPKQINGDTLFGIGSVTKIFTGIILAHCVQEGSIRLDESANIYLPTDLQLPSNTITLRQLVTHTSGLPNYPDNINTPRDINGDGINDSDQYSPSRNYSRQHLSDWLKQSPRLEFKPGSYSQYSNLGFGILALALQSHLNFEDFEELNKSIITKNLLMTRTHTNKDTLKQKFDINQAQGYAFDYGSLIPVPFSDMGILEGAGELVSTTNDLLLLLEGLTGIKNSTISSAFKESSQPLATIGVDKIGYGFKIKQSNKGGAYYAKAGSTAGYSSVVLWRRHPKIGIVLLSNRGNFKKINQLGTRLIEAAAVYTN